MLDGGMPVDSEDVGGFTALQYAAVYNETDVMHELLQRGADVNKRDRNFFGQTALHYSASNNDTDAMRLLLENGASTTIRDNVCLTPIDYARQRNSQEAVLLLQQWSKCFVNMYSGFTLD